MRRLAMQYMYYGIIFSSAYFVWKLIVILAGCEPPIAIVFHGSMGPAFRKGDILWLQKNKAPIQCGEIVVFKVTEDSAPIVHRVIEVRLHRETGKLCLLTKGDNNLEDDRSDTYSEGELWITDDHVYGRVRWYFPYAGWAVILATMKPFIKYPLFGALGLYLLKPKRT